MRNCYIYTYLKKEEHFPDHNSCMILEVPRWVCGHLGLHHLSVETSKTKRIKRKHAGASRGIIFMTAVGTWQHHQIGSRSRLCVKLCKNSSVAISKKACICPHYTFAHSRRGSMPKGQADTAIGQGLWDHGFEAQDSLSNLAYYPNCKRPSHGLPRLAVFSFGNGTTLAVSHNKVSSLTRRIFLGKWPSQRCVWGNLK